MDNALKVKQVPAKVKKIISEFHHRATGITPLSDELERWDSGDAGMLDTLYEMFIAGDVEMFVRNGDVAFKLTKQGKVEADRRAAEHGIA
jgi:hypothetical protein